MSSYLSPHVPAEAVRELRRHPTGGSPEMPAERRRHIAARLEDEFVGKMVPYAAAAGGAGAVKVVIATGDIDQARTIVENFVKNRTT